MRLCSQRTPPARSIRGRRIGRRQDGHRRRPRRPTGDVTVQGQEGPSRRPQADDREHGPRGEPGRGKVKNVMFCRPATGVTPVITALAS